MWIDGWTDRGGGGQEGGVEMRSSVTIGSSTGSLAAVTLQFLSWLVSIKIFTDFIIIFPVCKFTSTLLLLVSSPILPFYSSYLIEYMSKLNMDLMVIYFLRNL